MKGTEITPAVRKIVLERDSICDAPVCQYCGSAYQLELAHYVSRARGGQGVPENLVTLCHKCHQDAHSGKSEIEVFMKEYLQSKYNDWDESKLVLKKRYNKW